MHKCDYYECDTFAQDKNQQSTIIVVGGCDNAISLFDLRTGYAIQTSCTRTKCITNFANLNHSTSHAEYDEGKFCHAETAFVRLREIYRGYGGRR